ncbi:MAG: methyltransferase domain-containing protein [Thermoleophilia bacterium]|nr:methyltransferase domain-containing protein [Thermoleophilia bacterium]
MTRGYLAGAGVAAGMRVLEVGCGTGEVTAVLAGLVGPSGHVTAVDRDAVALARARDRMTGLGAGHVRLACADVTADPALPEALGADGFDVLAGRRVLMYLPDPSAVVRRLAGRLRAGGLVVFEEADATMVPGRVTPMPAHDRAGGWLRAMLVAEGADPAMGFHLPAVLAAAGLEVRGVRAEAVIEGQGTQFPLADLVGLMGDRIAAAGVATSAEVAEIRLRIGGERADPAVVYVSGMSFCAWARTPAT